MRLRPVWEVRQEMFTALLYGACALVAVWSWTRDRARTKQSFLKAWKAFENILPQFIGIIILIGVVLAILDPAMISRVLGHESGWPGVALAAVLGAVTLIPGFIAFPLAAMLMRSGAGAMQMGAFVSALMMVGIITAPAESRFFGWRMTALRNGLAFVFSFLVAAVIGTVVK